MNRQIEDSYVTRGELLHLPHLCILQRSNTKQEYGFKLLVDKKKGPIVGHVDKKSIAERSGLKPGHLIVAINDVYVHDRNYKEIIELIAIDELKCQLLVLHEDDHNLSEIGNISNVSLNHYIIVPSQHEREIIRWSSLESFEILTKTPSKVETPKKGISQQPVKDSCFSCPWTMRRIVMSTVIILGLFLSVSIMGSMIRRLTKKPDHFTIEWNDVSNDDVHLLNLDLENPSPIFQLSSPRFNPCTKATLYFDKKIIVHQICELKYCFITSLNNTLLPDMDSIEIAAKKSTLRVRAIHWEENWNYRLGALDLGSLIKLNLSAEICFKNPMMLQKSFTNYRDIPCLECQKVCLPEYGLTKDTTNGIMFLSIMDSPCFWIHKFSIPNIYNSGFAAVLL